MEEKVQSINSHTFFYHLLRSDSQEFFGSISPELGTNFVSMMNDTKVFIF